jgi:hypothetical protein
MAIVNSGLDCITKKWVGVGGNHLLVLSSEYAIACASLTSGPVLPSVPLW